MNTTTTNMSLSANDIFQKIMESKGRFVKVRYKSNPKPKAEFKNVNLEKITTTVIQAGCEFQNLSSVKTAIANGERSAEIGSLPYGEWLMLGEQSFYPYLITNVNKGDTQPTLYLRLTTSQCESHRPKSVYYVNGEIVEKTKFAEFLTNSEAKKLLEPSEAPPVYNIKLENLLDLPVEVD